MSAYADLSYDEFEQSGGRNNARMRQNDESGDNETWAIATAFQMPGDTLQTATASVRSMGLTVQRFFDPELGIVIGEKTPLMPAAPRAPRRPSPAASDDEEEPVIVGKKTAKVQRSAGPPKAAPPKAAPTKAAPTKAAPPKAQQSAQEPVEMSMRLNMDFQAAGQEGSAQRQNFVNDLTQDLADATGTGASEFNILKLSPGSGIVDMLAPANAAQELQRQSNDPNSKLRNGKLTRFADPISLQTTQQPQPLLAEYNSQPPLPFPKARENMYGIGLKIADFAPHKVLAVNNLRDEKMRQINHLVQKGDILHLINDTAVQGLNIDELEWHIFGPKDEMVTLSFFRPSTGQRYQVRVNHHIPIQFALGMSVTREAPYSVKRVDELLDPNNENIGDVVEPGDLILYLNGRDCSNERIRVLEDIIFGPIDSIVTIVFKSLHTGQNYEITFKRHIPVSSWVRWEEQGGMQAAMAPPVRKTPPLSIARGTPPIVLNMPMQPMAPNMGVPISGSPIPSFVPDTSYNAIPHKHNPNMPFDQPPQTFAQRPPQVYAQQANRPQSIESHRRGSVGSLKGFEAEDVTGEFI